MLRYIKHIIMVSVLLYIALLLIAITLNIIYGMDVDLGKPALAGLAMLATLTLVHAVVQLLAAFAHIKHR